VITTFSESSLPKTARENALRSRRVHETSEELNEKGPYHLRWLQTSEKMACPDFGKMSLHHDLSEGENIHLKATSGQRLRSRVFRDSHRSRTKQVCFTTPTNIIRQLKRNCRCSV